MQTLGSAEKTSIKIIKNEVGCRDDAVPKTGDTRTHCTVESRVCNNLPQPPKTILVYTHVHVYIQEEDFLIEERRFFNTRIKIFIALPFLIPPYFSRPCGLCMVVMLCMFCMFFLCSESFLSLSICSCGALCT